MIPEQRFYQIDRFLLEHPDEHFVCHNSDFLVTDFSVSIGSSKLDFESFENMYLILQNRAAAERV
jgi:hypothetical protein